MWGLFGYPHQVTVRKLGAGSGYAPGFGTPFTVEAEVKDTQRLVRDRDGAEVVSSCTVTVPLDTDVSLGSLVTVWAGTGQERESEVLAVSVNDNRDTFGLDSFIALSLT